MEGLALTTLLLLDRKLLVDDLRAASARSASRRGRARRLEHDIHDGAQQRLLALQMRAAERGRRAAGARPQIAQIQTTRSPPSRISA